MRSRLVVPLTRAHTQAHAHGRAKTFFLVVQTRRDTTVSGLFCQGSACKEEEEDGLNVRGAHARGAQAECPLPNKYTADQRSDSRAGHRSTH